jgi:hypothetical protein
MTMDEIAQKLKAKNVVFFSKEEMHDVINEMAMKIYSCARRNSRGRSFKQVYSDCSRIVIEYALAKVLGGERNPLEWDYKVLESYRWDVRVEDVVFEVKRHKVGTNWFSYPEEGMKTFRKHASTIDYFVSAYMISHKDTYEIRFALVANAKTFFNYFKPSRYHNQDSYYDHKTAQRANQCIDIGMLPATYP